jgi:hypothetical protein
MPLMDERAKKIEELVLEVLSFYEPMSFELILLDMPEERIFEISEFNREDLEEMLKLLVLSKKIKITSKKSDKEVFWIKVFPKKSLIERVKRWIS